jgi:diacylglycerol kinase (ATP)
MLAERAVKVLQNGGWSIRLERADSPEHFTQLAQRSATEGKDALFVVGGDGTINLAVRGLAGSDTALGILPAGTANVLAQELGLPGITWTRLMALEESARRLSKASVREVDIGMCGEVPFLMWAGVGLDGFAIHHIEPRPKADKLFANAMYVASVAWQASLWHGVNLNISTDHINVSGHYLLALISNINLYAGGIAKLSPYALLDDGIMDLWLFEGDNLGDTIQLAWDVYAGKHVESERVHNLPFQTLTIDSDSHMYVQLDGEPLGFEEHTAEVKVVSRGLKLLVPERTPRKLFMVQNSI